MPKSSRPQWPPLRSSSEPHGGGPAGKASYRLASHHPPKDREESEGGQGRRPPSEAGWRAHPVDRAGSAGPPASADLWLTSAPDSRPRYPPAFSDVHEARPWGGPPTGILRAKPAPGAAPLPVPQACPFPSSQPPGSAQGL